MSIPPLLSKVDPFIPLKEDKAYKPKEADLEKIKNYKQVSPTLSEGKAHLRDYLVPEPKILKENFKRETESLDDISNFPEQEVVPLPESRRYEEGKYRPASLPLFAGYYPSHVYLFRGKKYDWCSCGHSWSNPFCNGQCKFVVTRNRPISFNVSENGYYKLCNCKMSANAPFCSGTHKLVYKWIMKSNKGFFHMGSYGFFFVIMAYWGINWYQ